MMEIGEYSGQGLMLGLQSTASGIYDTSSALGSSAMRGLSESLSRLPDVTDFDITPVVAPILDLDDVTRGMNGIDRMLYTRRTLGLATSAKISMDSNLSKLQNGISVDNRNVVSSVEALREDVNSLKEVVGKLNVVLDTGTLVGAMVNPMDAALGRKMALSRRGI